jgi:outer membrane protein OmpA-like peptidoglycan-associated protein
MAAMLLGGCSSKSSMNPVNWWHSLEGGKIAEQRPPPPKDDAPYPNLATVPAKPAAPDRAALDALSASLVADRANAQHLAETTPLADPSNPSVSPALFGRGTASPPAPPSPPGAEPAASATLQAATAPPLPPAAAPPAASPSAAPGGPVQSAALTSPAGTPPAAGASPVPAPSAAPAPGQSPKAQAPSLPIVQAQPASAVVPMPDSPPPPPDLPGVPKTTRPTPVLVQGNATSRQVTVDFAATSASVPPSAADLLKLLAAHRGGANIAVTGYGDATAVAPEAQSAALGLALSRAKAVAAALAADGVPASAISVDAEAIGRGATARLIQ